jgi:hypothetical protein
MATKTRNPINTIDAADQSIIRDDFDCRDGLRTDRTYKSYENATRAVLKALKAKGLNHVTYYIAANAEGRFAPVIGCEQNSHVDRIVLMSLIYDGITVIN